MCEAVIFLHYMQITTIIENFRLIKFLVLLFFSLTVAACGGDVSSIPDKPISPGITDPLPELRILVVGQSISSNCNEHVYGAVNNVFQIAKDGSMKAASDPFEWADCNKGSMWMPLGKKIIEAGIAHKVVFMPIGVGSSKVEDWQTGGAAFSKLNNAIALIQKQGITFNLAFWHQGSSNLGMNQTAYVNRVGSVLDYVSSKVAIERWIIAVHSRCGTIYDQNIESAQLALGGMSELKRYPGPNNNSLGNEYRFDNCHLNQSGQEKMASMWLESIKAVLK
ncbi:hypothetical protein CSQ93_00765 [Janthinobacterium sp. BJB426]|nr:hypothetical protein CSQ93_00765 [Janthinobacterium sp. BJB426]